MAPRIAVGIVWANLTIDACGIKGYQGSVDKGCDDGVPELHDESDELGEQEE